MTAHVTAIERVGQGLRARRIVLDDFSERTTADVVVKVLGLAEGNPVSPEGLEASLAQLEPVLAREAALRLLGRRERSVSELTKRLTQGGFPHAVATSTVSALERAGLVDDARFAEMWARSRVMSGYGSRRIRQEFAERGVDADVSEGALLAALDGVDDLERARVIAGARPPRDRRERERLLRRLVSRGFDLSVAMRALDANTSLSSDDADLPED